MRNNLKILNLKLKESLEERGYEPVLMGNLFYKHAQRVPPFYDSELSDEASLKRERITNATQGLETLFEVGLNGGHSALLMLSNNDKIKIISNDIAKHYPPCPDLHPEVYVEAAAEALTEMFPDRFTFLKGDCLKVVPEFVNNNKHLLLDAAHIDGEKSTYARDFLNLKPLLKDGAIIIFDDSQMPTVRQQINHLLKLGEINEIAEFPDVGPVKGGSNTENSIFKYVKST
mgnify:FL=1|jgi:hypothetical protein